MNKDSGDSISGDSLSDSISDSIGESKDFIADSTSAEISADSWLDLFKIALVNKNYDSALALLDNLPHFDKSDDLLCARALVDELSQSLKREKSALSTQMEKLKQTKRFLVD